MKQYLTIGKFAKLRGLDINSLRYYERLGILTPAYVDPRTRYRYYAAEQLSVLDMVLLCINLGIPLKQLASYVDENGNFHSRALFEEGRRRAEEKIRELQGSLQSIEHTLNFLEDIGRYEHMDGPYTRVIPQRRLVVAEFGGPNSVSELETAFSALNSYARERRLYPVLPMSILYRFSQGRATPYVCWEISDERSSDARIVTLPRAEYRCLQVQLEPGDNLEAMLRARLDLRGDSTVLVSNMGQSRLRAGIRIGEIQQLPGLPAMPTVFGTGPQPGQE